MTTCKGFLNCFSGKDNEMKEEERHIKDESMPLAGEAEVNEALDLLQQMEAVDKERGYRRVVRPLRMRLRRLAWWRWTASVAAACVAIVCGMMWWGDGTPEAELPLAAAVSDSIVPGKPTARLILAGKEEILLDTLSTGQMALASGVVLRKEEKGLVYEVAREKAMEERMAYNELIVPRGGEYDIVLEDGTRVWMNADSRLRYPLAFGQAERRVYLEGEAYFEVRRDVARPFFVETARQTVRVLGTTFNVSAYPEDGMNYATLVEGSVAVADKRTGEGEVLVPGEQARLNVETGVTEVAAVDVRQVVAWKSGMFVFDGQTLEQIMAKLARWYNVSVFFRNAGAKSLVFKGNLPRYTDFREVLEVLEKSSHVRFSVHERTVTVNL